VSKNKTVSSAFHIRNHQDNKQLKFCLDQQQTIKYEPTPEYLGINLDSSLTFKHHIEQLKSKSQLEWPWLNDWLAQNGEHPTELLEYLLWPWYMLHLNTAHQSGVVAHTRTKLTWC